TNNDRNVIMSQNIEGHRGDKDIESLIKFIESNTETKGKPKNNSTHTNGPVGFNNKQRNNIRKEEMVGGTKTRKEKVVEDGHEEEKSYGKNRVSGKQSSKDNRNTEKVGTGGQLKKSNSLEEISKTKLEDLTSEQSGANSTSSMSSSTQVTLRRPKKQTTLDEEELFNDKNRTAERRSWGTEESQPYYCSDGPATVSADESGPTAAGGRKRRVMAEEKKRAEEGIPALVVSTTNTSEETEFHVVTKKTRRKKRRSSSGGRTGSGPASHGGLFAEDNRRSAGSQYGQSYYQSRGDTGGYYQRKSFNSGNGNGFPPHDRMVERDGTTGVMLYPYRHRPRSPEHLRRKSTSSMPPSDKSDSSDLDSVHSLPVSSTTPKLTLDQTSTSSGSTPQASYADITRMASANVSSSSSTQGSCYMNVGKWPAVSTNKNQSVPGPNNMSSTSVTTTVSVSSTVTISSTSTTTVSTCSSINSNSAPALATHIVPNNPQFITGPRLNIGVPPVSGSKVTASTSSSSTSNVSSIATVVSVGEVAAAAAPPQQQQPPPPPPPPPVVSSQNPESVSDQAVVPAKHRNNPPSGDSRTKKDAMTCTTLDTKLSPSEEHNTGVEVQGNIIMDQYYPSLEESLVSDKGERKPGRSGKMPVEDNSSDNVAQESVASKSSRHQDVSSEIQLKQPPVEVSVDATVIVPRSNSCITAELVPSEVTVTSATVMNRSKEGLSRSKSGGRKLSAAGSNIVATSLVRPPVIIMDEQEQEAAFRDNIDTVSDLTFGFEVNEQLLKLDSDDSSAIIEPSNIQQETRSISSEDTVPIAPIIINSASEDFSARYREPVTQQSDIYDLLVTFVGSAWDDIVRESSQAGGKVQYYSGQ
ncbi:hypothetical protein L9F63_005395, partial [Diploptera punctata]